MYLFTSFTFYVGLFFLLGALTVLADAQRLHDAREQQFGYALFIFAVLFVGGSAMLSAGL